MRQAHGTITRTLLPAAFAGTVERDDDQPVGAHEGEDQIRLAEERRRAQRPSRIARELRRHVVLAPGARGHVVREDRVELAARAHGRPGTGLAAERAHQRRDDAPRDDERRRGVAGKSDDRLAVARREHRRFAGLDRDPVDEHAGSSEPVDDARRQVAHRDRRARRKDERIGARERRRSGGKHRLFVVGDDPARDREAAGPFDSGRDRGRIDVADLTQRRGCAGRDDFVAGREHRDARAREHFDGHDADRRQRPQLGGAQPPPRPGRRGRRRRRLHRAR